jgi:hypothetical protein
MVSLSIEGFGLVLGIEIRAAAQAMARYEFHALNRHPGFSKEAIAAHDVLVAGRIAPSRGLIQGIEAFAHEGMRGSLDPHMSRALAEFLGNGKGL